MKPLLSSRRQFLRRSTVASLVAATLPAALINRANAIQPFNRPGKPRLYLGLAAYSFRDFFKDSDHKREKSSPAADQIDMFQFVDYCADHGCDGAEVTSYYFP